MSWLFSQALVEEYSEATCSDGEQSAPSNGNAIQQAYCAPDKMTAFSRLSRFGMTYKPLTETRGEELLMLYREGFHAKTLVPQEKAQELMESAAGCGEKWRASFTKYDPDSSLWRIHQCSLAGDLDEFLETWPQWGLMRDGECWEQRTLEQIIRGTGYGLSPQTWPTPDANCGQRGTQPDWKTKRKSGQSAQYTINQAVWNKMYPTPTAHNAKERGYPAEFNRLTQGLDTIVQRFPTPQASDCRDMGNMSNPSVQRRVDIGKQISLSQSVHPTSGQLNPTWVEWLMVWPLGWTDLKPLEMDKYPCAPQPPGEC